MKWKISTQVILRRGEGVNEQQLLYFVVFFRVHWTREMFGSLTVIKTLNCFVCPRKPFRQINDFSRGFILKLGSQKRRIINAHLR